MHFEPPFVKVRSVFFDPLTLVLGNESLALECHGILAGRINILQLLYRRTMFHLILLSQLVDLLALLIQILDFLV